MNVENPINSNSSKLIEREEIEGTPFWIIGEEEKGYFLSFGKWKLTEDLATKEDVFLHLTTNKWEIILKMILCMKNIEQNLNEANELITKNS